MRTLLKIKVEKIIEVQEGDRVVNIPAGAYEQTVPTGSRSGLKLLREIIALVNNLKIP